MNQAPECIRADPPEPDIVIKTSEERWISECLPPEFGLDWTKKFKIG